MHCSACLCHRRRNGLGDTKKRRMPKMRRVALPLSAFHVIQSRQPSKRSGAAMICNLFHVMPVPRDSFKLCCLTGIPTLPLLGKSGLPTNQVHCTCNANKNDYRSLYQLCHSGQCFEMLSNSATSTFRKLAPNVGKNELN